MKKRKKGNMKLIYILLLVVVFMATGYAVLTQTIEITGSATASTSLTVAWDADTPPAITDSVGASSTGEPELTSGDTILTIDPVLDYPGAYVEVTATVENTGTLDAIITDLIPTDPVGSDIVWSVVPDFALDQVLVGTSGTVEVVIRIEWDSASTDPGPHNETFGVVVEYSQDT